MKKKKPKFVMENIKKKSWRKSQGQIIQDEKIFTISKFLFVNFKLLGETANL